MSYRDDFNSSMNSPGNYSSSSNYGGNNMSGNRGGNFGNFGGTNNPGFGFQTTMQSKAFDAMRQARNLDGRNGGLLGTGPWPGGYAIPVLQGQVPPAQPRPRLPAPSSYPPVTQEEIPGAPPPAWQPQRYVNPGYGMDPNGIGRTVTPRTAPRGYFGPSQPTYSRDGQGYVSNAGPYGGATYARMGSDFRSIDSW
jgi:hypothetical protein